MQSRVDRIIPREHFLPLEHAIPAAKVGHEAACLPHEKNACSDVPGLQIRFPKPVEPSSGYPREIERCRTKPTNTCNIGRNRTKNAAPLREVAMPEEGNAGRDHTVGQIAS